MCIIFYVVFIKNIKHYFRGNNMEVMYTYDILNGRKSRYDRITTEDIIHIYVYHISTCVTIYSHPFSIVPWFTVCVSQSVYFDSMYIVVIAAA